MRATQNSFKKVSYEFPLAPMGVLAPPIETSGNLPAHVSAESPLNISTNLSEEEEREKK
jgi:hypothetical protein